MSPRVSVVVPVFNAAEHVEAALESLLRQTLTDLEVVVVNDGSTDASLALCRQIARFDSRVRVLDRPNAGVSAARNSGLAVAAGEYVTFLDSDDRAESWALQHMVARAEQSGADVVVAGCTVESLDANGADVGTRVMAPPSDVWPSEGAGPVPSEDNASLVGYVWNKLYRRAHLVARAAVFPEGQGLYEDLRFNAQVLADGARVVGLAEAVVVYAQRPGDSGGSRFVSDFLALRLRAVADLEFIFEAWGVEEHALSRAVAGWHDAAVPSLVRRTEQHAPWSRRRQAEHVRESIAATDAGLRSALVRSTDRRVRLAVRHPYTALVLATAIRRARELPGLGRPQMRRSR